MKPKSLLQQVITTNLIAMMSRVIALPDISDFEAKYSTSNCATARVAIQIYEDGVISLKKC